MCECVFGDIGGRVGNIVDVEYFEFCVFCDDDFGDGGYFDGVVIYFVYHVDFGGGFVVWFLDVDIDFCV